MRHVCSALFLLVFVTFTFKLILGILVIPERTTLKYVNEKYVYNASATIVRFSRKSAYYYNLEAGLYHTWGNNVTLHMVFYEALNTQYRRSLIEIHLKICDMLQHDQYFGKLFGEIVQKHGLSCPFKPAMYRFLNITLPTEKFPNLLTFQKGKLEITFTQLPTQDVIGRLETIFTIKQSYS